MRMLHLGKKVSTKLVVLIILVSRITYGRTIQPSGGKKRISFHGRCNHDVSPTDVSTNEKSLRQCVPDQCVPTLDRWQELDSHNNYLQETCVTRDPSFAHLTRQIDRIENTRQPMGGVGGKIPEHCRGNSLIENCYFFSRTEKIDREGSLFQYSLRYNVITYTQIL